MRNYNQQYAENQELSVFKYFFINKGNIRVFRYQCVSEESMASD